MWKRAGSDSRERGEQTNNSTNFGACRALVACGTRWRLMAVDPCPVGYLIVSCRMPAMFVQFDQDQEPVDSHTAVP